MHIGLFGLTHTKTPFKRHNSYYFAPCIRPSGCIALVRGGILRVVSAPLVASRGPLCRRVVFFDLGLGIQGTVDDRLTLLDGERVVGLLRQRDGDPGTRFVPLHPILIPGPIQQGSAAHRVAGVVKRRRLEPEVSYQIPADRPACPDQECRAGDEFISFDGAHLVGWVGVHLSLSCVFAGRTGQAPGSDPPQYRIGPSSPEVWSFPRRTKHNAMIYFVRLALCFCNRVHTLPNGGAYLPGHDKTQKSADSVVCIILRIARPISAEYGEAADSC